MSTIVSIKSSFITKGNFRFYFFSLMADDWLGYWVFFLTGTNVYKNFKYVLKKIIDNQICDFIFMLKSSQRIVINCVMSKFFDKLHQIDTKFWADDAKVKGLRSFTSVSFLKAYFYKCDDKNNNVPLSIGKYAVS